MMKKKNFLSIVTFCIICYLTVIGADCKDLLQNNDGDIEGSWQLVEQAGYQQDVCDDEIIEFNSGIATLRCPDGSTVTRNYDVSSSTLIYSETGIEYEISFPESNQLELTGVNISRNLLYQKPNSTTLNTQKPLKEGSISSENKR